MESASLDQSGRIACLDHVHASLRRSSLIGIPASTLLALILRTAVPAPRLVALVVFISLADIATFVATTRYFSGRRRNAPLTRCSSTLLASALVGAAWGTPALIALPDEHHIDLRVVYLLFVCGVSATLVVGAAASRRFFFAGQLPMLLPVACRFLASSNGTTRMIGFAVPVYFGVMTMLHAEVHRVVISEIDLRARNDEANAKLRQRALTDELTGLANRAAFIDALSAAIDESAATGRHVGLLYMDVDRFKIVNDSLGHVAGDELLRAVGERIRSVIRPQDVLSRVGGDEFTLLLTDLPSHEQAIGVAKRIVAAFETPFEIAGRDVDVTISVGLVTSLDDDANAKALLAHADAAQVYAKQAGRNRVEVFDVGLREALERQLDDEQELRRALRDGEIVAWFQPLFALHTGRIVGAEALARWHHPTRGVLDAGKFIALAEETGLVDQLDAEVVTAAFRARAELAKLGVAEDFRIWCNVSALQFGKADPTARLVAALERTGCDPSGVGIEITETAVLRDIGAAAREVGRARDLGVEVALDDFGTGHSSLTLLRDLRIDKVKIDRSFVLDVGRGGADLAIIESVVALANKLGIDVVGEGVETTVQAHVLRDLGCRYAQGFLWSRAIPLEALIAQLAALDHSPQLLERIAKVEAGATQRLRPDAIATE